MSELYKLPKGWEWKKLGELAKFQSGGTPSRSNKTYWENGDIPWVKISDITDDMYVSKTEEFITKSGLDSSSAKLFSKGTILYTIFATIGKIGILDIEATTNQAISGIQPNENVDLFYMYYGLKFITNEIQKISVGVAQNNINLTKLKEQWFPLPPLEEQKKIVEKLDLLFGKIDKAIELHQKNIDEADIFMASVLNDVFEELEEKYPIKKVSDGLKNILTGTTPPTRENKYYEKPTINWYSPSDFGKSKILTKSKNMINTITIIEKKAKIYEKNTLLLVAIGATVGKIGVIKEEASSNQQITALKFNEEIEVDFSYYWFHYIKQIIINTASAATLPIINQSAIKDLKFITPPLKTQQKVVLYLDEISQKIEKIKELQKSKMQSLKELKASILDKAFRGEL